MALRYASITQISLLCIWGVFVVRLWWCTFDGLGHTITLPAGAFRPFDEIRAKGVVKNLGIRTENRSKENVSDGALALENHGRIENVWHTGDMTVTINAIPKDKNDKDEWQSRENVLRGGTCDTIMDIKSIFGKFRDNAKGKDRRK